MSDRSVTVFLKANVDGLVAGYEKAKIATTDLAKTTEAAATQHKKSWDKAGSSMLITGGVIAAGVGVAVAAYTEFDHTMSTVKANIDDKSVPSMQRLADAAMTAGKVTEFSATAAAQAEVQLSKVGVTSAQITGGALVGVLALAAATEIDLPTAASIAAAAMNQFGLSAAQIPHVADLLASAANHALGGVIPLSEALKFVGVAASQFGISIDSTVGVLAMFASNGITGTMAGTGFRMMLIQMAKPTAEATDLMKQYNITAFDSQGKFVGMATLAGELHTQLGGLTVQEREHALAVMFGTRALAEANILYAQGAEGVKKWTDTVNQAGFAQMQASTKLDNLAGDWQIFGTSVNVALIKAGASGNDMLRNITGFATGAVNAFGELPAPILNSGLKLTGLTGVLLILGGGLITLTPKIVATRAALADVSIAGMSAGTALKGFGAAAAVATVAIPLLTAAADSFYGSLGYGATAGNDAAKSLEAFITTGKATGENANMMNHRMTDLSQTIDLVFNGSVWHRAGSALEKLGNAFGLLGTGPTDDAVAAFKTLDSGLASMATSGHAEQAAGLFKKIADEAKKQGYTLEQVTAAMPGYSAAVTSAGKAAGGAAKSADDLARSNAKAGDALVSIGGKADATGSAMRLIGAGADAASAAVKDLAKSIQTDMDAASKAFRTDMDVLGGYDPSKKGNLSLQDAYKADIAAAGKFATDIAAVTAKGLDPNVIAKLLQEGPAKAEPALQSMLSGNSSKMIAMVNTSEASLAAINARVIEQSRLTAMAVNSNSDQMSKDFSKAMQIDAAIATSGGKATTYALAAQLHIGAGDVKRIAAEFGIGLADGISPGVVASKKKIDDLQAKIDSIRQGKVPSLAANPKAAQATIDALQAKIDAIKQGPVPALKANATPGVGAVSTLQTAITGIHQGKVPGLNANPAQGELNVAGLQSQIDDVKQHGVPGMNTDTGVAKQKVAELQAVIDGIHGRTVPVVIQYTANGVNLTTPSSVGRKAGGGPIDGIGTGTSDSNLILASKGEHMLTAADVTAAGGHGAVMDWRKSLHGFKDGGEIPGQPITITMPSASDIGAAFNTGASNGAGQFDVSKMFPAPPSGGGGGGNAANKAIMQAMATRVFGWGSQLGALDYLMMRESGYNNTAQNPTSTAYGMGQFLDSTWAGYGPKTSDVYLQSLYVGEYIKGRYVDPNGAAAHERAFNWYSDGTAGAAPGWGMVGENGKELVYFYGGETVVPNHALGGAASSVGYASGTGVNSPMSAVGQQYTAGMNPSASAAAITASIAAITALTAAWKTAIAAADAAAARAKLIADIAAAVTALNTATKAKDAPGIATARQSYTDAKAAVVAFDEAAKVAAEDAKIAADQAALATAQQMAADREAAAQKLADNRASWAFDHMNAQQQLADVNTRMAAEQTYSDTWMSLAKQRESLQSQIAAANQSALDAAMSKLTALNSAQNTYDSAVSSASATLAQQTAQLTEARTVALATWAQLSQTTTVGFAPSMTTLISNGKTQLTQFTKWMDQLALARQNGVSESVISTMGLDQGPQQLAQLQQINKGTVAQVTALNALVAQKTADANAQMIREKTKMLGDLGKALLAAQQVAAAAIAAALDAFNAQLAAAGTAGGTAYTSGIADGMLSNIPEIIAAAQAVRDAMKIPEATPGGQLISMPGVGVGGGSTPMTAAQAAADQTNVISYQNWAGMTIQTTDTAANRASIASSGYTILPGHAGGGWVDGTGTAFSDSNLTPTSKGEFVVNAAASAANASLLTAINNGQQVSSARPAPITVAAPQVHVYVDGAEFKGLVRVEIAGADQAKAMTERRMVNA